MKDIFKTIIDQSTDIVFVVENVTPHKIIYGNKAFYEHIAGKLTEMSLQGMDVDGGALSLHEEFILNVDNQYYSFFLEPFEEESVFLFHKGAHVKVSSTHNTGDDNTGSISKGESQFFKLLNNKVPCANFQMVLDDDGKMCFSYLSDKVKKMFKLETHGDEAASLDFLLSKVHPLDVGRVLKSMVHSARLKGHWECVFRISVRENSEPLWVLGRAVPENEAKNLYWYGTLVDISALKQREMELEKAKYDAETSSKVKSDFISTIIHEIRTPLNAISGSVFSLLEEGYATGQKQLLNNISFATDSLIIMVNDLLDFQKTEAGKIQLEYKPFNLRELLGQVIGGLKYQARESKNILNLIASDHLDIGVVGDKLRLAQILNNLISNGLKFTNQGRVDVTATLAEDNDEEVRIYFEVKDTGIGIARENLKKVFNEFEQINQSFDVKYGGTGLGMPITKKLLELMGSEIQVESEEGKGSTFFFELTFGKVVSAAGVSLVPPEPIKHAGYCLPSGLKVLLAEDNDVNAIVIMKIIKRWEMICDRVYDGQEAVDFAGKKKYDIILMDIQMPVMDGCKAAKCIKEQSDVPIIALTASSKNECCAGYDLACIDRFVYKPINAVDLQKNIHELVMTHIS
ncbi:response regulator [Echinicola soli]|uniref:histidine kinase n=1 Tax=Echinicola soli TaxID=2591634 RepID=A0A514CIU3_9BACT|nr:ATP-binding protein [Echinicola soli]QDH79741.1 response regulator [Echinicola soli]